MMKKIVSIIIVYIVLLSYVSCPAMADTAYGHGYFEYYVVDGGIEICNYFGEEETVEIPNNISGLPVSGIVGHAFVDCPSVKTLILPDTIMYIDEGAISPSIEVRYLGAQYGNVADKEETTIVPSDSTSTSGEGSSTVLTDGVTSVEDVADDGSIGYEEVEEVLDEGSNGKDSITANTDHSDVEVESPIGGAEASHTVQRKNKLGLILSGLVILLCLILVLVKNKRGDK